MSRIVASGGAAAGIGVLFVVLIVIGLYFLPTIVAYSRKVPNMGSVLVINLLLGWTFIGWVVAMAMAARSRWPTAGGSSGAQTNATQPPHLPLRQDRTPELPTSPQPSQVPTPASGVGHAEHEIATEVVNIECPNGHTVPTSASFCPSCGSSMASRPQETTPTGAEPPYQRPLPGWARRVEDGPAADTAAPPGD